MGQVHFWKRSALELILFREILSLVLILLSKSICFLYIGSLQKKGNTPIFFTQIGIDMKIHGLFFSIVFFSCAYFQSYIFIKQLLFYCKHLADENRGQYVISYKSLVLLRCGYENSYDINHGKNSDPIFGEPLTDFQNYTANYFFGEKSTPLPKNVPWCQVTRHITFGALKVYSSHLNWEAWLDSFHPQ